MLKEINAITKRTMLEVLPSFDKKLISKVMQRECVYQYIMENGTHAGLLNTLRELYVTEA